MRRLQKRDGFTRRDVIALLVGGFVLFVVGWMVLGRVDEKQKTQECAARLGRLAKAVRDYHDIHGQFPGYLNVLQRDDGTPYVDPDTRQTAPVSWAVMILPFLDHQPLYDRWRSVSNASDPRSEVLGEFLCPREFDSTPQLPFTSYVANTGQPDAPQSIPTQSGKPTFPHGMAAVGIPRDRATVGIPRDWAASGIFFDHFTDHPLVNTATKARVPMEYVSDARIKDLKSMTILLTENVDATEYMIRGRTQAANNWKAVEIQTGCTWHEGPVDRNTTPPTVALSSPTLQINVGAGTGNGSTYDYCRPSSRHPGGVNVAYADQSIQFLNEKTSYFVFAKLMASDDDNLTKVGSMILMDAALRQSGSQSCGECDVNP